MKPTEKKIKYFAYVRKSSEGEERQAMSIPAQKDKLRDIFPGLDIEFIEDKASAFKPFNRPEFTKMMKRLGDSGDRQGLIAWHPDRLSRNEVDAGEITYMLRTGHIKDLKFGTYHFENNPEGIWMLQLALSQSQYESAKKGRDVKRGLGQKAKMGIYPAPAPLGYMNDKFAERGNKTILPDPARFDLVRKMWDTMLTGNYSASQITKMATNEWGFRTLSGKKLSHSNIYLIFTRPFYYGEYEYPVNSGNWYQGIHKPMITKEEYDRVQFLMGRRSQPRVKTHNIAYRGPMRCGGCGAMITAEEKYKKLAGGGVAHYTYYHCTRRRDPNCVEGAIEQVELEKQIASELAGLEIPVDFKDWALARLRDMNAQEVVDREHVYGGQRREYDACVRKIDNLIDMRANNELDEQEFRDRKTALLSEKERLQQYLRDTDRRVENWLDIAERGFNFAEKARELFATTKDLEVKKGIFTALGSDFILKDRKLHITLDNLLAPIKKAAEAIRNQPARLEPFKNGVNQKENGPSYARNPVVLGVLDDVRTILLGGKSGFAYHFAY